MSHVVDPLRQEGLDAYLACRVTAGVKLTHYCRFEENGIEAMLLHRRAQPPELDQLSRLADDAR